jgi:flagellar export protein FliJ
MRAFQFPLETVRQWRHTQREIEEGTLARLFGERQRIAEERRRLEESRSASERSLLAAAAVPAAELAALDSYRQHIRAEGSRLDQRDQDCAKRIAAQRRRVLEARQKAELLDRLKARKLAEWRSEVDRGQEALAAELYLAKWRGNQRCPASSAGNKSSCGSPSHNSGL